MQVVVDAGPIGISNRGSPAATRSPGSLNIRFTTPDTFDLTVTSFRGTIEPTASAFSITLDRSTLTTGPRSFSLKFRLFINTTVTMAMTATMTIAIQTARFLLFFLFI